MNFNEIKNNQEIKLKKGINLFFADIDKIKEKMLDEVE